MADHPLRVTINVDGGSRGNPGNAGAGIVIRREGSGEVLYEAGLFLGHATNNVAEYSALLAGLEKAAQIGAAEATIFSDSELMIHQINGHYRVKNEGLRPLFEQAQELRKNFQGSHFIHVRRELNAHADKLANLAMDKKQNFEKFHQKPVEEKSPSAKPARKRATKAGKETHEVLCCQFDIDWENPDVNFQRITELLEDETVQPGCLILLPETFSTGFSMNLSATLDPQRRAEHFLADLAKQHKAFVLGGVVSPASDGRGRNEALAFDPAGNEIARYAKMHPFSKEQEQKYHQAGDKIAVFDWNGMKVAPFICYDLRFPEAFRAAVRQGAQLLAVIANWPKVRQEYWKPLLAARAIENQAFVAGVNRCGQSPNHAYAGESVVFSPYGKTLAQADHHPKLLRAKLDLADLEKFRGEFPALNDIRADFFNNA